MSPTAETAIEYARWVESMGWRPTPLHVVGPDGKTCTCPKGAACGRSAGKHNVAFDWQKDLRGVAIFEEMLAGSPREDGSRRPPRRKMNVGILTGEPSGIFVLDVDPKGGGVESMKALRAQHGPLPQTFTVQTGTGGWHFYFQIPDFGVRNSASKIANGVDVRGDGGMVVGPGSVSWAGPYNIVNNVPVAPAPDWLLETLRPAPADPFANAPADPATAAPAFDAAPAPTPVAGKHQRYESAVVNGELAKVHELRAAGWTKPWDITTFNVACQLVELANSPWAALTLEEAYMLFLDACPPAEPGYDPEAKWASALQKIGAGTRPEPTGAAGVFDDNPDVVQGTVVAPDPRLGGDGYREGAVTASPAYELSDLGNANRLIHWYGNIIRYSADSKTWITYDSGVWRDSSGEVEVERLVTSSLMLALRYEADSHSDVAEEFDSKGNPKATERDDFVSWLGKSQMYAKVVSSRQMARSDLRVRVDEASFDADPMLLNVGNCAINLATGEAIPHAPELLFRHKSSVQYDPNAQCPTWLAFLERVQPDPTVREYLQRVLGYSLTGRMDEHAIFIHVGPGANGKTTFLEVVKAVMGDYGQKLDRDTLLSKSGSSNQIPADIARMAGARLLAASEIPAGRKLDDERVKELTGGDTQTARRLYGDWFDFTPTGKIHMVTNHLPGLESGGEGMGRRMRIIAWETVIPEPERDKTLKERIVATEASGVLTWLVEGARRWAQLGLITPQSVIDRSREHIEEADPIMPFIHERLEVGEEFETETMAVYGAYESWSRANGNNPMSGRAFSMAMVERLGADCRFRHHISRRSMMRVRLKLMAVPDEHAAFFSEGRR